MKLLRPELLAAYCRWARAKSVRSSSAQGGATDE